MKLPAISLFSALFLQMVVMAQEPNEHSPLQREMETINRDMRKLNRQYADPAQKASSSEIVTEMQKSVEKAKTLVPPKAEKLPEAEKAKYLSTYKKDMDALETELAALKGAVDAGANDKTKAELDKINHLKMDSHKELGVKMGGPGGGPRGPGGGGRMGPPPAEKAASPESSPSPAR